MKTGAKLIQLRGGNRTSRAVRPSPPGTHLHHSPANPVPSRGAVKSRIPGNSDPFQPIPTLKNIFSPAPAPLPYVHSPIRVYPCPSVVKSPIQNKNHQTNPIINIHFGCKSSGFSPSMVPNRKKQTRGGAGGAAPPARRRGRAGRRGP